MNEQNPALNSKDGLYACMHEDKCCIRVKGRGSFKVSTNLKRFIEKTMAGGVRHVMVDLRDCTGMDSTFMGVLAGLTGHLKQQGIDFFVVNISEKNQNLLQTLGINRVLKLYPVKDAHVECACPEGQQQPVPVEPEAESKLNTAETMLEAHKNLTELNQENIARFKSVIDFLETDVRKLKE